MSDEVAGAMLEADLELDRLRRERDDARRERDACHALFDDCLRALGFDPGGPRPMLTDAVKQAAADARTARSALAMVRRRLVTARGAADGALALLDREAKPEGGSHAPD